MTEDGNRGTYCSWCGKPGGRMYTTMSIHFEYQMENLFHAVGATLHFQDCFDQWKIWIAKHPEKVS